MSTKPVAIEYLLKDGVSSGLGKIEGAATSVEKTFTRTSDNIKNKLREQKDTVKLVEGDLRSLEGQLSKMTPGTAWLEMKAEVEACRKVLTEEKVALADIEQQHDKAASSGKRLSRELRVMQDEMTKMRLAGKQLTPEYVEMEQKAAVLADTLGDVRAQTNVLAHDNAGLQGVISGVSGLTGGITAAVGVMGVFTKNNEDLVKVQTKVQSVLAITMGLQQMMNVLNRDSAFRLVTLRKAKDAFAAANTRLAVALGISNIAAKALMATLTLGLSAAIGVAIALWDRYRSRQAAAKEEAEAFSKKIADSAAKPISAINELSAAWSKLGNNLEAKQKFVEENKKRFDELGISVGSVTDAENLLVANKAKFVEACLARAKALAVQELAVEKYKEVLKAQQELDATPKAYVTKKGTYTDGYGTVREGKVLQKSSDWQEAEDVLSEAQGAYDNLISQQVEFSAAEREIMASINAGADGIIEGSVAAIERVIASKRELLKNVTDRAEYDRITREIKTEEKKLAAITGTTNNGGTTSADQAERQAGELARVQRQLEDRAAQARIDAMDEGLAKTLEQNKLNHAREIAQIEQLGADLLAAHKRINKDITELPASHADMLATMTVAAGAEYAAADKEARDEVLADMMTFQQKYARIIEETNKKIKDAQMAGASLDMFGVLSEQEGEQIDQLAEEFAQKSDDYETFMRSMVDASIEEIQANIDNANSIISQIVAGGIDESEIEKYLEYRARLVAMQKELKAAKNEKDSADSSKEAESSNKSWQKLYGTLRKIGSEFDEIGEAVGGTTGEIIKTAGTIATSALSGISAITQLANWSITATQMAATGASAAIIAVEKASVILAVIGAVIQVITIITGLFKDNEEQLRAAADAAREYEAALEEIGRAQRYDLFDTIFGTDGVGKFQEAKAIAIESIKDIRTQIGNGVDITATFDGRSGWNKFWGTGDHKIKNTAFDINEFINSDGSLKLKELQEWYKQYEKGLSDAEKTALQNLIDDGKAYEEAIQVMTDHIDQLWGDLASSIADNMIDAFLETGDAAKNLGELVDDVAKNMAKSMIESLLIEDIFNKDLQVQLLDMLKLGDQKGANKLIQDAIASAGELAPIIEGIITSLGLTHEAAEKGVGQSGKAGAFTTMTQDEGAELKGLFTSVQMILRDIYLDMEDVGPGLAEATGVLVEIREEVKKSNGWLGKMYDQVEKIIRDGLKIK
ncbi:MAG: hypothetical protein LBV18_04060 [Alistipes sp.]|jgi:hypothetical protein|nr:hypothetical protein [Alistipes sp.]